MAQGVSHGGRVYMAISIALISLTLLAILLRFWASRIRKASIRVDDILIVIAELIFFGMAAQAILWAEVGKTGFKTATLTPSQLTHFFQIFWANQMTYSCICPLIKISICLMYGRIFDDAYLYFRWWKWTLITLCTAWGVAVLLVSIFQCSPVPRFWNPTLPGRCIDGQTFFWGNAISNLLLDVIILATPLVIIWGVKTRNRTTMPLRLRLVVSGIFLLGGFVCIASILRIVELGVIADIDVVLTLSSAATWTTVEPGMRILAACLPRLKPLFERLLPTIRSSVSSSRNRSRQLDSGLAALTSPIQSDWELQDLEHKAGVPRVSETDGAEDIYRYGREHTVEVVTALVHSGEFWDHVNEFTADGRIQPVWAQRQPVVIRLSPCRDPLEQTDRSVRSKRPGDSVGWVQVRNARGMWKVVSMEDLRLGG